VVVIVSDIKGTHEAELDLSSLHMGITPATNRVVEAGREHSRLTFQSDKISSWVVEPTKTAGLIMFLNQLGIKPPVQ
jgi:hypothetical protein